MALSTCRDCNREVSTLARHCVHCGRPRPAGASSGSVIGGIIVVAIALALTAGVVCAARQACRKMKNHAAWAECRYTDGTLKCSFSQPRPADKATFVKSLEEPGTELIELRPGVYELKPGADAPEEDRK